MGWETRGNGRYFYRARKVGGRVRKTYVGTGPIAETAAADVAGRRAQREAEREETRRLEAVAATIREQKAIADATVAAALEAAGYHRHHRGEWRKRRA